MNLSWNRQNRFFEEILNVLSAIGWIDQGTESVNTEVVVMKGVHARARAVQHETDSWENIVEAIVSLNRESLIDGQTSPCASLPLMKLCLNVRKHPKVLRGASLEGYGVIVANPLPDQGPW